MLFDLYKEPPVLAHGIALSSILTTFTIWLFAGYLFKLAYFHKNEKIIANQYLTIFALVITFINWLGLDINLYIISPVYFYLAYISYRWIPAKSLKWINLSTALFILFIISTYAFFNYKIHYITYVFFSSNDILEYTFKFKPYFLIYHVGDFLGSVQFTIAGEPVLYTNEPLQYRIYLFYYTLNFIGLAVWFWIYLDVLKKHKFNYEKALNKAKSDETHNPIVNANPNITKLDNQPKDDCENITKTDEKVINNSSHSSIEQVHFFNQKNNVNVNSLTISKQETMENIQSLSQYFEDKLHKNEHDNLVLREAILNIKEKEFELKVQKHTLVNHPIFSSIKSIEQLRVFMEHHVYCVWDFMSLLKRLQREICCVQVPWNPVKNAMACRLINEIVLGEESDITPNGNYASHFDIYIQAMEDIGANTQTVKQFIHAMSKYQQDNTNEHYKKALNIIPPVAAKFVNHTLDIALNQSLYANLGSFFHGRENVIPGMFSHLLKTWSIDEEKAPMFHYYLIRHIELDGDEHGPAGDKLIHSMTEGNTQAIIEMLDCSILSVKSRIQLWNDLQKIL